MLLKKNIKLVTKLPLEVILGSGAAAAIAAVFSAPIGAAIFAHEAIIRRFGSFGAGPRNCCGVQCPLGCFTFDGRDYIIQYYNVSRD